LSHIYQIRKNESKWIKVGILYGILKTIFHSF